LGLRGAFQPQTHISVLRQSGEKLANCRGPDRGVAAHDRQMAVAIERRKVDERVIGARVLVR
jgi:hypothetical protein